MVTFELEMQLSISIWIIERKIIVVYGSGHSRLRLFQVAPRDPLVRSHPEYIEQHKKYVKTTF